MPKLLRIIIHFEANGRKETLTKIEKHQCVAQSFNHRFNSGMLRNKKLKYDECKSTAFIALKAANERSGKRKAYRQNVAEQHVVGQSTVENFGVIKTRSEKKRKAKLFVSFNMRRVGRASFQKSTKSWFTGASGRASRQQVPKVHCKQKY